MATSVNDYQVQSYYENLQREVKDEIEKKSNLTFENDDKIIDYQGSGSTNSDHHIYLVMLTTLPLHDKIATATDSLFYKFSYARKVDIYDNKNLKDGLSAKKIIPFINEIFYRTYRPAQGYVIPPDDLRQLVNLAKEVSNDDDKEICASILNGNSEVRKFLHRQMIQKIQKNKNDIAKDNRTNAISALKKFRFITAISYLFKNLVLWYQTYRIVKQFNALEKHTFANRGLKHNGIDVVCHSRFERWK